jgi:hypothetical protein
MGMFGAWFVGAAVASQRLVRAGLALAAASALAGAWRGGGATAGPGRS